MEIKKNEVMRNVMKSNNLVFASLIFTIGLIIAAYLLSSAINQVGYGIHHTGANISSSISNLENYQLQNYELIVNDGWLYLYNKVSGDVWKKEDNQDSYWEYIQHFSQQVED